MKPILIKLLQFAISFAILGYLLHQLSQDKETLDRIWSGPKNWLLLIPACLLILFTTILSFVRWKLLVGALGMKFSLSDALRLGLLGYLFNFLSVGIAGGDVIKMVFLARQHKGYRTEAVTTVVFDRIIGLFGLLVVGSLSFVMFDISRLSVGEPDALKAFLLLGKVTVGLTLTGTVVGILLMVTGFVNHPLLDRLTRFPGLGGMVGKALHAVRTYRNKPRVLIFALLISLAVHCLLSAGIYLIARAITGNCPSLSTHCVIVPIANIANAAPLPGGLGAFEAALDAVYRAVSPETAVLKQGFVVALGFRFITLLVAGVGVFYRIVDRQSIAELVQQSQEEHSAEA